MRTIVVAVAILSACFMQEVSGAFLSATPKKEAKVELKELQQVEVQKLQQQKLQQALTDMNFHWISKAGASEEEEDEEEEQDEEHEERGSRRNQDDEEDDQGEEQDLDVDEEHMSEALKKLGVKAEELHAIADKEGASEAARVAARQAEKVFDQAEATEARAINAGKIQLTEEMQEHEQADKAQVEVAATSQSIMALLHRAEDLAEEAQKVGASDAAKKAAAQAEKEFAEADAKAHLP